MAIIKAQKVPKSELSAEQILYRFCYYFPQYTLQEARALRYKTVIGMLQEAEKIESARMLDTLWIALAPNSKKLAKQLIATFRERAQ